MAIATGAVCRVLEFNKRPTRARINTDMEWETNAQLMNQVLVHKLHVHTRANECSEGKQVVSKLQRHIQVGLGDQNGIRLESDQSGHYINISCTQT